MMIGNMCHPVSTPSVSRGRVNSSGHRAKCDAVMAKLRWRRARLSASLSSCTSPKAADSSEGSKFQPFSSKMNRLSYSRPSSMALKKRSTLPFCDPKSCSSERRPQRRKSSALSASASSSKHTIPPVPAAVMMCERAKLVREMSARAPVGVPRSVRPRASQESSTTTRSWRSAISRMASQSGALPMRFGVRMALVRGVTMASMASTSIWKVSGVTSTKAGTIALADHRRDVGGEGHGAGDDLVARLEVEHFDGQVQRRAPGVAHDASPLGEELGDAPFHGLDVLADAHRGRTAAQHPTTASISRSSWTDPAYSMRRSDWMRLMGSPRGIGTGRLSGRRPTGRRGWPGRRGRRGASRPAPRSSARGAPRRCACRRRGRRR